MASDIEIARAHTLEHIVDVAARVGLGPDDLEQYGPHKAKVAASAGAGKAMGGKLVLVTAITPTPAGEGKTTTTIGLADGLRRNGVNACAAIREPSLGPCLGMKGGATGGGHAQVVPMEDINLHFTGDLHAVTSAHNLLSALLDNTIHHGVGPRVDPRRTVWRRVIDMNDRALRSTVVGLGGRGSGVPRETGFDITAASEVMASLCLAEDLNDLQARIGRTIVGYDYERTPITAGDLNATGAMAALLKDAVKPNLVQTLEGTPVFVHGGPFANIAHGTSSVIADKLALKLADIVVTEAGFGCDLGAEKFFDIFCRSSGLSPSCVVLVATVRALKMHGDVALKDLGTPDPEAVQRGLPNLEKHLETLACFGVPALVVVNRFTADTDAEVAVVTERVAALGHSASVMTSWADGGAGATEAAAEVARLANGFDGHCRLLYEDDASVTDKILAVATNVYGAKHVDYTAKARQNLKQIARLGFEKLPVCIAKTQKSLSDNPKLLGRPKDFLVTVREIIISAGAGFLVPITGDIMRMPGLAKRPAAFDIGVDDEGNITGLS